jgi:trans-aconitate methyltransferase
LKNTQISAYLENRDPKAHHLELINLIAESYPNFDGELLDIGCAAGHFLELIATTFKSAKLTGFDISDELIEFAKDKKKLSSTELYTADLLSVSPDKKYDIICASGVMSIYQDFEDPLTQWCNWLKPGGSLFVFGRFNSADIDTIIKFRNNYHSDTWEDGLSAFSCNTVTKFCKKMGLINKFIRFYLPIDIPKQDDPIKTYTKITVDGEKLIVNGANIIAEHFHLIIKKPE